MKYSPQRVGRYKKLSLMSFRNVTTCFLVTLYFQRSLSSEEDHKHCRKVLLQRGQNKAGFHRDLLTYVEWDINNIASNSDLKNCHLLLLEHLPNGIYVDPDQIRSGEEFGGPQVFSRDAVNVESLAHHASSNRIFVLPKMVVRMGTIITANVSLPVHLRYHQAAVNKKFMSVSLSPPTVLGRCNGYVIDDLSTNCGTETIKAPCYDKTRSDSCDWLILKSAIESTPLVFHVPVGQIDHVWPVVAFTVLSTMAGCAVVVWNSFTSTLDR